MVPLCVLLGTTMTHTKSILSAFAAMLALSGPAYATQSTTSYNVALGACSAPIALPANNLPVTAVDFSCRLPVVTSVSQAGGGITLQGAFISFPSAQIQEDPAGTMHSGDQDFTTSATPVLDGNGFVPFYDRAQSRWVPAPARQALADPLVGRVGLGVLGVAAHKKDRTSRPVQAVRQVEIPRDEHVGQALEDDLLDVEPVAAKRSGVLRLQ